MYSGPYLVGAIDIESPVSPPRVVDTTRFKDSNEKPFELQTSLVHALLPGYPREKLHQEASLDTKASLGDGQRLRQVCTH